MGLLDRIQIWPSTNVRIPANTTTIRSSIVDMQGAEGCLFTWQASSNSSGAALVRVMGSTGNTTGGMKSLRSAAGTAASTAGIIDVTSGTYTADNHDRKVFAIDVVKPAEKRYVMLCIDGASGMNALMGMTYGLKLQGSTEAKDSTTIGGTTSLIGAATS